MTFNSGLVLGDQSGQEKNNTLKLPLAQKGGTLPSWRSSSCRAPFVHPFMPVPSSSPLIKIRVPQTLVHPWLCGWISFGLQVASFHCTGTLLYTQYTSHHHTAWSQKCYTAIYLSVWNLGMSPSLVTESCSWIKQSSWSFQVSTFIQLQCWRTWKKHVPIPSVVLLKGSNYRS